MPAAPRGTCTSSKPTWFALPRPECCPVSPEPWVLPYGELMSAAGYDSPDSRDDGPPRVPTAVKRYSNAHIVELLEGLQREMAELRLLLDADR